jgi:HIRAN domain
MAKVPLVPPRAPLVASYAGGMPDAPVTVDVVFEERYWYPDDGGVVWLAGYQLVEPETGRYLARDAAELAARGLHVVGVAGAGRHHAEALATADVGPGRPLALRRDPENEHDPSAIAIEPAGGGEQVGWVPREVAAEIAPALDTGEPWAAVVLRERRASPRDPRTGLSMLLAPGTAIELREAPRRPPP